MSYARLKTELDFMDVVLSEQKRGYFQFAPEWNGYSSQDLMIRGGDFYAILDHETNMWKTGDKGRNFARRAIDTAIWKARDEYIKNNPNDLAAAGAQVKTIKEDAATRKTWLSYVKNECVDNYVPLDPKVTFRSQDVKPEDYRTHRLPYDLAEGPTPYWDKFLDVIYRDERHKIEYMIGSIIDGPNVKKVQKYYVIYGEGGTGKSSIIDILDKMLFPGYASRFNAADLVTGNNAFPLSALATNPMIAYDHEARLTNLLDNSYLNSIATGEPMLFNLKFAQPFEMAVNTTMIMAANEPPKITNRNAGSVRRIIDICPSGDILPTNEYYECMDGIAYEVGAIATKCLNVFRENKLYYRGYEPYRFMGLTDPIYSYVLDNAEEFSKAAWVTLSDQYRQYKMWCEANGFEAKTRNDFKRDFSPYWETFSERAHGNRSVFEGFKMSKLQAITGWKPEEHTERKLKLEVAESLFETEFADCPAQYEHETLNKPLRSWDKCTTTLRDIDTSKVHYVRVPLNHIVIDLDLKAGDMKDADENLKKAAELGLPKTYTEFSKSGAGVHMHYIYDGDPETLSRTLEPNVEIKVFTGKSSLRRRFSYCNGEPIAHLPVGSLPERSVKVVDEDKIEDERHLRNCIEKALRKDMQQPYTTPCMSYIKSRCDRAKADGVEYDITDLEGRILSFAASSSNQADECLKMANAITYCTVITIPQVTGEDKPIGVFDFEVFPNFNGCVVATIDNDFNILAIDRYKFPTPKELVQMSNNFRLVGFNNAGYDDYIATAIMMGYDKADVYALSALITSNEKDDKERWARMKWSEFSIASAFSYTDVYDFSSVKQSLKAFENQYKIKHKECQYPWNEDLDPSHFDEVMDYCENDVIATVEVFKRRVADFKARQILAGLAGGTPRMSTNNLTKLIIFGADKNPQSMFCYRDLAEPRDDKPYFPGYTYQQEVVGKTKDGIDKREFVSRYKGYVVGEGGFVWAQPGMYFDEIYTFDVASMHPSSIIAENLFGPYTKRFKAIKDIRVLIKHKDFESAKRLLNEDLGLEGRCDKYLEDPAEAKGLAQALKIAINSVYGLTSATFPNQFKDPRNIDNIVAKRGALFMIDLLTALQEMGATVVHIKTDSIKVANPTPEVANFIVEFGKKYGYDFEIEHVFQKMCLVNNAVYIAKLSPNDEDYEELAKTGHWTATGAMFLAPYTFKTLFSHERIDSDDLAIVKSVQKGAMYLDTGTKQTFVGRNGCFISVRNGASLVCKKPGVDKASYVTGTKGYGWMEYAEYNIDRHEPDYSYYDDEVNKAVQTMLKFGDVEAFVDY